MLTLVTSNTLKYASFAKDLERWRVVVETPKEPLPEIQSLSFLETLAAKAQAAARMFGRPVLVDDAGLVLKAYEPFPGPLTSATLRSLGSEGLQRLLTGVSDRATMECHLGCWIDGELRSWSGCVEGRIDFSHAPRDKRMILSDLFVPDTKPAGAELPHRAMALAGLGSAIFDLHLRAANLPEPCVNGAPHQCPFCIEINDPSLSIFAGMMGEKMESRIIYEDDHFIVVPVLGQFTEGGLLLLSRAHIPSFSHLAPNLFEPLERLMEVIRQALTARWGVSPLFFEHGPGLNNSKGGCCVDHAHFNIFPATARVEPHLNPRMRMTLGPLSELNRLRSAEFGYLFVQENDGSRNVFDGQDTPSQLVRRIVTREIGFPERWHWRDYPGFDELLETYRSLKGRLKP